MIKLSEILRINKPLVIDVYWEWDLYTSIAPLNNIIYKGKTIWDPKDSTNTWTEIYDANYSIYDDQLVLFVKDKISLTRLKKYLSGVEFILPPTLPRLNPFEIEIDEKILSNSKPSINVIFIRVITKIWPYTKYLLIKMQLSIHIILQKTLGLMKYSRLVFMIML
jgi:hypothetical protein